MNGIIPKGMEGYFSSYILLTGIKDKFVAKMYVYFLTQKVLCKYFTMKFDQIDLHFKKYMHLSIEFIFSM